MQSLSGHLDLESFGQPHKIHEFYQRQMFHGCYKGKLVQVGKTLKPLLSDGFGMKK